MLCLDGREFLYSFNIDKSQYKLFLTDMKDLFIENLTRDEFKAKFDKLNDDLEDCDIKEGFNQIKHILSDISEADRSSIIRNVSDITINMEWSSDGIPFRWEFILHKSSSENFEKYVTCSLTSTISLLIKQREELFSKLRDKDLEIEDYVNSGAKISLKSLKTDWFEKDKFVSDVSCDVTISSISVMSHPSVAAIIEKLGDKEIRDDKQNNKNNHTSEEQKIKSSPTDSKPVNNNRTTVAPIKKKIIKASFPVHDNEKRRKTNHLKKL